jgi:hypothetical protein
MNILNWNIGFTLVCNVFLWLYYRKVKGIKHPPITTFAFLNGLFLFSMVCSALTQPAAIKFSVIETIIKSMMVSLMIFCIFKVRSLDRNSSEEKGTFYAASIFLLFISISITPLLMVGLHLK